MTLVNSPGGPIANDVATPIGISPTFSAKSQSYFTRVSNDGGEVAYKNWVNDHIAKLESLGWYDQLVMCVDPAAGWKDDGNGNVQKLYDLSSNQFDPTQGTLASRPSHEIRGWGNLASAAYDGSDDLLEKAHEAALSLGENTAWFILWYNVAANGLNGNQAFSKSVASTDSQEFNMRVRDSIDEVDFNISSSGSATQDAGVVTPGANQWIMFYGAYDDTDGAETLYASVNDGSVDTDTLPNSPNVFTVPFQIGAFTDVSEYYEGSLGLLLYGKRPNPGDPLPHENAELGTYYDFCRSEAGL